MSTELPLDQFWQEILSRDPERVNAAWQELTPEERIALMAHLQRMATEPGWTDPQRLSAKSALQAVGAADCDD